MIARPNRQVVAGNPGVRPLGVLALMGLAALGGTLCANGQTVSSRLEADVPRWMGAGSGFGGRGWLSSSMGDTGFGQAGTAATFVGGQGQGLVADTSVGYGELMGLRRSEAIGSGVVGQLMAGVVDWLEQHRPLELLSPHERVYAAASGSAGESGPLFVEVGTHQLMPNEPGQWVTLTARNESASPVVLAGLNFNVQIADSGPVREGGFGLIDGPNITQVDLVTGTLFAGTHTGTTPAAGNVPQAGLWTVTTLTGTLSLAPGQVVTLARVEIDTGGFQSQESWTLSLTAGAPGGLQSTTSFVRLVDGGLVDAVDVRFNPGLVVVPEPRSVAGVAALGLAVWVCARGVRRRRGLF